ncbi:protein lin-54 homolog isoform X2 [Watersipora subatra]|uniref:protein lin-54 homolog isoform X2 n=1 Tax=Watersipora subatra TaxID=2589382 RepID=UPI00355BEA6A
MMESRLELNLPEPTIHVKTETYAENFLLSSPSLQSGGDITSMIDTCDTPTASLRTPTKVLSAQSSMNKQTMSLSPTRLFIKQDMGAYVTVSTMEQTVQPAAAQQVSLATNTTCYQPPATNNSLQYVRIVSNPGDGLATPGQHVIAAPIRPNSFAGNSNTEHLQLAANHIQPTPQPHQTVGATNGQRVLLPAANNQTLRISGTQSLAQIKSQLPPGTTILSSSDASGQMLAFLPTNHTIMPKAPPTNIAGKQMYPMVGQTLIRSQEYNSGDPGVTNNSHPPQPSVPMGNSPAPDASKQKKPCNCTKSQCLKLYCDCFANGEFCSNCNCQNCYNNLDHEEERQKAVKQCLERNPQAFHPKIGKSTKADARRHQKGCNCKRSGCLKNYCECYEAKIPCGSMCKCVGCKNCEGHDSKGLMHLADAADFRHSQISNMPHNPSSYVPETPSPHTYLKKSVIEAIIDCLVAQCREAEMAKCKDSTTEKVILEEYGRCLSELIKASSQRR